MNTLAYKTRNEIIESPAPCPSNHWLIGLDIGYSGVKGKCPNKYFCIPYYARRVPDKQVVLKEPDAMDIRYRDEKGTWVVGSLAYDEIMPSEAIESEKEMFGRNRYFSDMFRVVSRTGIGLALMQNRFGSPKGRKISLQTGLPSKFESDDVLIKEVLSGVHKFEIKVGKLPWQRFEYELSPDDIRVIPQPLGSLVSASTNNEGKQLPVARTYFGSKVVIFDPGFGTMDDYIVLHGTVVDYHTSLDHGMKEVFRRTCEKINGAYGLKIEIPELQKYLATGEIRMLDRKLMKRTTHSFANLLEDCSYKVCLEAIEKLKSDNNYFIDVDYIIGTGGTYDAWAATFNDAFKDMDGLKIIPGNINEPNISNIYSNVRGYYYHLKSYVK